MKYVKLIPTGSFNPQEITREEAIEILGIKDLQTLEQISNEGYGEVIDMVQVNPELYIGIQH